MGKQRTFADKMKKTAKVQTGYNVKVIKGYVNESGNLRFLTRFVKVNDLNELTNIDINK
ncbi:MAG: hypothetical protein N2517_03800 [Ignavibacteria bacterium]|nr:hypothetical protein [Ignavibacteria bacterium]